MTLRLVTPSLSASGRRYSRATGPAHRITHWHTAHRHGDVSRHAIRVGGPRIHTMRACAEFRAGILCSLRSTGSRSQLHIHSASSRGTDIDHDARLRREGRLLEVSVGLHRSVGQDCARAASVLCAKGCHPQLWNLFLRDACRCSGAACSLMRRLESAYCGVRAVAASKTPPFSRSHRQRLRLRRWRLMGRHRRSARVRGVSPPVSLDRGATRAGGRGEQLRWCEREEASAARGRRRAPPVHCKL